MASIDECKKSLDKYKKIIEASAPYLERRSSFVEQEPIEQKPTYDRLHKVRNAQKSLLNYIKDLEDSLRDPGLSDKEGEALQEALIDAKETLAETDKAVPLLRHLNAEKNSNLEQHK